jgi:hypothetical protein
MTPYNIVLFLHVAGALGIGAGAYMTLFGLWNLRRAQTVDQARTTLGMINLSGPILGASALVNILTGLYMTTTSNLWQAPWIIVTIVTLVLYIIAGAVMGTRRAAIDKLIKEMPDGPLPQDVAMRILDPVFGTATYMMMGLLAGIIFLMTVKPLLNIAIIGVLVAVILAALASLSLRRTEQVKESPRELRRREG